MSFFSKIFGDRKATTATTATTAEQGWHQESNWCEYGESYLDRLYVDGMQVQPPYGWWATTHWGQWHRVAEAGNRLGNATAMVAAVRAHRTAATALAIAKAADDKTAADEAAAMTAAAKVQLDELWAAIAAQLDEFEREAEDVRAAARAAESARIRGQARAELSAVMEKARQAAGLL